jgi:hypothetical protein
MRRETAVGTRNLRAIFEITALKTTTLRTTPVKPPGWNNRESGSPAAATSAATGSSRGIPRAPGRFAISI